MHYLGPKYFANFVNTVFRFVAKLSHGMGPSTSLCWTPSNWVGQWSPGDQRFSRISQALWGSCMSRRDWWWWTRLEISLEMWGKLWSSSLSTTPCTMCVASSLIRTSIPLNAYYYTFRNYCSVEDLPRPSHIAWRLYPLCGWLLPLVRGFFHSFLHKFRWPECLCLWN